MLNSEVETERVCPDSPRDVLSGSRRSVLNKKRSSFRGAVHMSIGYVNRVDKMSTMSRILAVIAMELSPVAP